MPGLQLDRKRVLIVTGVAGCLGLLIAFAAFGAWLFWWRGGAPTLSARATITPTLISARIATATLAPTLTPTPAPTRTPITDYVIYVGKDGLFSIKYPRGWTVNNQEALLALITFSAPDRSAQGLVKYGAAGNQTAEQALNAFINDPIKSSAPDARVITQRKNIDGSAEADVEFTSMDLGGRVRGLVRVFIQPGGLYYATMFSALVDKFDPRTAETFVEGLSSGK